MLLAYEYIWYISRLTRIPTNKPNVLNEKNVIFIEKYRSQLRMESNRIMGIENANMQTILFKKLHSNLKGKLKSVKDISLI